MCVELANSREFPVDLNQTKNQTPVYKYTKRLTSVYFVKFPTRDVEVSFRDLKMAPALKLFVYVHRSPSRQN